MGKRKDYNQRDIPVAQDINTREWVATCPWPGCKAERRLKSSKGNAVAAIWAHMVSKHGKSLSDEV